jgi:hypothetical protein
MIKAKEFINMFENVYKVKSKGEILYNVLMEKHDKMIVNNLICETLHPENSIAKLYRVLQKAKNIINSVNECDNKTHKCRK